MTFKHGRSIERKKNKSHVDGKGFDSSCSLVAARREHNNLIYDAFPAIDAISPLKRLFVRCIHGDGKLPIRRGSCTGKKSVLGNYASCLTV